MSIKGPTNYFNQWLDTYLSNWTPTVLLQVGSTFEGAHFPFTFFDHLSRAILLFALTVPLAIFPSARVLATLGKGHNSCPIFTVVGVLTLVDVTGCIHIFTRSMAFVVLPVTFVLVAIAIGNFTPTFLNFLGLDDLSFLTTLVRYHVFSLILIMISTTNKSLMVSLIWLDFILACRSSIWRLSSGSSGYCLLSARGLLSHQ